jgi:potassium efflux system protein
LDKLKTGAAALKERIEAAGVTQAISVLLRKQRADLPDVRSLRRRIRARQSEMSAVQLQLLELHDERAALADLDQRTEQLLAGLGPTVSGAERQDIEGAVRSLLQAKRDYVESLRSDLDSYFGKLVDLDMAERDLVAETKDSANYIDENILWFRSTARLGLADFPDAWEGLRWLAQGKNWTETGLILKTDARTKPVLYGLALVAFAAWLFLRRRLVAALHGLASRIHRAASDSFGHTIVGLAITVTLATGWPALIGFLAWRLWDGTRASGTATAIASGLRTVAILFLTLELLRQTCRVRGLAELHFQWRRPGLRMVHKNLIWFMAIILPVSFVFSVIEWQQENDAWKDSLGRLTLMAGLVALAVFAQRVLRPTGRLLKGYLSRNRGGWLDRLRYVWYPLSFGTPVVLAVAAAAGYQYTAAELTGRLVSTLWLVLALVFANAVMLRWLYVARRRLALEKAQKRAAAEAETKGTAPETTGEGQLEPVEEPEVDIFNISSQTSQLVRSLVGVALLLGLWLIWADVLPALGILHRVRLWSSGGDEYVTLASLALAVLITLVTVVAAKNFPGLLEIAVLQRLPMDHGVRYAITAVARYLTAIVGTIVAFGVIGIGWSKVQWLVAAMTVGLGFGLQEIFANFISGLIILFERPMRVGDTVTVGDITGTVTRIQIRATTIRDWNRKELVVPNKEFVTGQLINWTLSDTVLRLVIPVGIAYGSDTKLAHEVLLKVAREHPHVSREPEPAALFVGFGESSLNFELRVFIPSMEHYLSVWHDLHMAIDAAFREAGIEIAFPQQDVHIRSIRPVLPIVQKTEGGSQDQ